MRSYAILLVEDNPDDVKQTLRAFARNNIANEVVVARDGAEALDYLFGEGRSAGRDSSIQPGLVLLDLKLPRVTGLEVLARIRADDRTRGVPVVILTSSSEAQDVAAGYAAGANNYLRKPVHFASFLHAARSVGLYWTLVESGLALLHPAMDDAAAGDGAASAAPLRPLPPRPMEVLLGMADHEAAARLAAVLEGDGHLVRHAPTAREVFGRLLASMPDALILDEELPQIHGIDVVRTLREFPEGRAVTSVILSSDVQRCRAELPDDEVRILDGAVSAEAIVALMRRLRFSTLLRDLAAERERVAPSMAPADNAKGVHRRADAARTPSPADPWHLLDLPASAPAPSVAHAVQSLTNALEERAAQATSAQVRTQAGNLAARLRQVAKELVELHPSPRR